MEILRIRSSEIFVAKKLGFSKIMVCPHGQGGMETFFAKKKSKIFRAFVRAISYDHIFIFYAGNTFKFKF